MDGSTGCCSSGFARADANSTSGHLVPDADLRHTHGPLEEHFSEIRMSGGHEQTLVGIRNGDIDAGLSWADGQGNCEDGDNSGAFRKAADAGLIDMNELVEI
nr:MULTISPECIES: PhnD/SsuA/transferrin family substrate-binding protein [unclassified Paracoccus (in: a-proteobacteria)]